MACLYCREDRDGYTKPLEKNCHAYIVYPNKLRLEFGKVKRECEIRFCPMCGGSLKRFMEVTNDA